MVNWIELLAEELAYVKPPHYREDDIRYPSNPVDRKGGTDYG